MNASAFLVLYCLQNEQDWFIGYKNFLHFFLHFFDFFWHFTILYSFCVFIYEKSFEIDVVLAEEMNS